MKLENVFVLLVGASGSGKSTIARMLEFRGYKILPSYTTRPQRFPDEEGHVFVPTDYQVHASDVVAFTKFDGHAYWATHEQVDESDVYIVDPSGVESLLSNYTSSKVPIVVYINVPAFTRFWRMLKRGDGFLPALRRIIHDRKAFKNVKCTMMIKDRASDSAKTASAIDGEIKNIEELVNEGIII